MTLDLVDAHCHVDLFPFPEAVAVEAGAHKVHTIAVTNAPHVFHFTQQLAEKYPHLLAAAGLHPKLVANYDHLLNDMLTLLGHVRYVGEVGLDYVTIDKDLRARQRRVFESIISRCARTDAVVSIHSRRAVTDVLSIVGKDFPGSCILHWFSGTPNQLRRAIEYGFYFSVNPPMVASPRGTRLVSQIPRDRLLTESDGPFVRIAGRPATPPDVLNVVNVVAGLWGMTVEEATQTIYENLGRIIKKHG